MNNTEVMAGGIAPRPNNRGRRAISLQPAAEQREPGQELAQPPASPTRG